MTSRQTKHTTVTGRLPIEFIAYEGRRGAGDALNACLEAQVLGEIVDWITIDDDDNGEALFVKYYWDDNAVTYVYAFYAEDTFFMAEQLLVDLLQELGCTF